MDDLVCRRLDRKMVNCYTCYPRYGPIWCFQQKELQVRAEHTVDVVRKALASEQSFVVTYNEYKMVTTVAFDDKVHHFYINDQEMCRIYQNIEDVQSILHIVMY